MKNLVKSTILFQNLYKQSGLSVLTNCETFPEFHNLLASLEKISVEDVSLNPSQLENYFRNNTLTYMEVLKAEGFSVDLFCLPKGCSLKLHDHTDMLAMTKILHGSVRYRSMDLVDKSFQETNRNFNASDDSIFENVKLEAVVNWDRVLRENEITFLNPVKGNIHSMTAQEDTIFLDILLPNYNQNHQCNYYEEISQVPKEISTEETKGHGHAKIVKNDDNAESTEASDEEAVSSLISKKRVTLRPVMSPDDIGIWIIRAQNEINLNECE